MKKETKYAITNYPGSEIFLDDIEFLYNTFNSNFERVFLTIGRYKLDSLDEISRIQEQEIIDTFKLVGSIGTSYDSPNMTLTFEGSRTWLHLSDDENVILLGVKTHIDALINKRKRFWGNNKIAWGIYTISLLFLYTSFSHIFENIIYLPFLIICAVLIIFSTYTIFWGNPKHYNHIHIVKQADKPSFFKRNRDSIILILMGAIVGSVVTFLFNFFIIKR